jgi:sporulation protein YlmC with PRC-barrel domain
MLHRLSRLRGCHVHAIDGEIGHVDDVLVDERSFAVQYVVVDTSNWIGGKWVAISPSAARNVDWGKQRIDLDLTRDQIKNGPTLETLDLPGPEARPNHAFIF